MPESDRNSLVGLFSRRARVSSKTGSVRLTISRWRPIKEKWRMPIFSKCHNFVNNSRNCTKFEAPGELGGPFDFSFLKFGGKWTLISTEKVGVGMV